MTGKICPVHKVPFKKFTKGDQEWYAHKQGDVWCNEAKVVKQQTEVDPDGDDNLFTDEEVPIKPVDNRFKADPEKQASIEKQNAFSGMIALMVSGVIKRNEPLGTDIINYGLQKLGIPIGKQYDVPKKEIEKALASSQSQIEPPAQEVLKPKRDLPLIKTGNDLFKACKVDFGIVPQVVLKTLNVESTTEIKDMVGAYNTIANHFKN